MEDRFGHRISYLRVSITDRCNERCTYCMPQELQEWLPRHEYRAPEVAAEKSRASELLIVATPWRTWPLTFTNPVISVRIISISPGNLDSVSGGKAST